MEYPEGTESLGFLVIQKQMVQILESIWLLGTWTPRDTVESIGYSISNRSHGTHKDDVGFLTGAMWQASRTAVSNPKPCPKP